MIEGLSAQVEPLGPRAARARAKALRGMANLAGMDGDSAALRACLEEMLELSRKLDYKEGIAWALHGLGSMARTGVGQREDPEAAERFYEESLANFREIGHRAGIAELLGDLARIRLSRGDYSTAQAFLEEGLQLARRAGRTDRITGALEGLASVAHARGDRRGAQALLEEALELSRDTWSIHFVCRRQGDLLLEWGDNAAARSRYEETLGLCRAGQNSGAIAWALLEAGHAAWLQEDSDAAKCYATEALAIFRNSQEMEGIVAAVQSLSVAALQRGQKERAARLMGAAEALREALGRHGPDCWPRPRERVAEAARSAALEQEYAAAWAAGRVMSLEDAIRAALRDNEIPTPP